MQTACLRWWSSTRIAIITCELDGVITNWNPAAARLFGLHESEIVGKSVSLLSPKGQVARSKPCCPRSAPESMSSTFETISCRKDGTVFPDVSDRLTNLRPGRHCHRASAIGHDVTRAEGSYPERSEAGCCR